MEIERPDDETLDLWMYNTSSAGEETLTLEVNDHRMRAEAGGP